MSQDEPTNIAEIRRRLLDDYKEKAKSGAMFRFLPCLIARTRKARDGLDGPCDITAAGLTERKRPRKISLVFFFDEYQDNVEKCIMKGRESASKLDSL